MEKNKKDKIVGIILTTIIAFNIILILSMMTMCIYMYGFNNLNSSEYKRINLNVPPMEYTLTKDEVRKLVKDLYNTPHFYKETNNMAKDRGAESVMILRLVKVRKDINLSAYAVCYAHELTHLKYFYGDETMTEFTTFKILYESGNSELQHMALLRAQDILNGVYKGTEYDVSYYIFNYLKEVGYLNGI